MQKLVICILMLAFSFSSFCQSTTTREQYLSRAKSQKTTALVLSIGGSTLFMLGGGYSLGEALNNAEGITNTGDIMLVVGGAAMLGSIPFFIASKKNKKKGVSLGMRPMKLPQLNNNGYNRSFIAVISLKLEL